MKFTISLISYHKQAYEIAHNYLYWGFLLFVVQLELRGKENLDKINNCSVIPNLHSDQC